MVEDELSAAIEQIDQPRLAVRTLEDVALVDLDHGEPTALGRERVSCARMRLLLAEQLVASGLPFG